MPLDEDLSRYDAAVVVTDHTGVDYAGVARTVPLVLDTRNVYGRIEHPRLRLLLEVAP